MIPEVVNVMLKKSNDLDISVRYNALSGLLKLAERSFIPTEKVVDTVLLLLRKVDEDVDEDTRQQAVSCLAILAEDYNLPQELLDEAKIKVKEALDFQRSINTSITETISGVFIKDLGKSKMSVAERLKNAISQSGFENSASYFIGDLAALKQREAGSKKRLEDESQVSIIIRPLFDNNES